MDTKTVERYILEPFKFKLPDTNPPIRQICLRKGAAGCIVALLLLTFASVLFVFLDQSFFFIIVISLVTFLTVLLSVGKYKRELQELSETLEEECAQDVVAEIKEIERLTRSRRNIILWAVAVNILARDGLILFMSTTFIALFIIYLMCSHIYRFYLINKYCPYLITFEDRRYYGRDETVIQ